jgi:hypothetical protein
MAASGAAFDSSAAARPGAAFSASEAAIINPENRL